MNNNRRGANPYENTSKRATGGQPNQEWIDDGAVPEDLDLYSVSTAVDSGQPNYPPSNWLSGEGWTPPVLLDNDAADAASAWGLPGYPYFVFVDADGNVWHRGSGQLPARNSNGCPPNWCQARNRAVLGRLTQEGRLRPGFPTHRTRLRVDRGDSLVHPVRHLLTGSVVSCRVGPVSQVACHRRPTC